MDIVEHLKRLFEDNLISVCLHNLGLSAFNSNNGLLVVLNNIHLDDIKKLKLELAKFKKQFNTPLLIERDFLEKHKKHFCIEILELKEHTKVLYGSNPANTIDIDNQDLKNQIKREIASKILSIRGSFLELTLERKIVEEIAYRSLYNFYLISKYILYLNGKNSKNVFEGIETLFNVNLENTKKLFFMEKRPTFDKLLPLFEGYLKELDAFSNIEL